jgi:hypothetical protein
MAQILDEINRNVPEKMGWLSPGSFYTKYWNESIHCRENVRESYWKLCWQWSW